MDGNLDGATHFPFTITLDTDDLVWTHLSTVGRILTLQELPLYLRERVHRLVRFLNNASITTLELLPDPPQRLLLNGKRHTHPHGAPDDMKDILLLLGWWMEWSHRRAVSRGTWSCPECAGEVTRARGHCTDSACVSWNILHLITGESILHLVPKTGTNAS